MFNKSAMGRVEPDDSVEVVWNGETLGTAVVQRIGYGFDGVMLMVMFPYEEGEEVLSGW